MLFFGIIRGGLLLLLLVDCHDLGALLVLNEVLYYLLGVEQVPLQRFVLVFFRCFLTSYLDRF